MNMNIEKILRYATILSDSSSVPQKFPFADVPAERILEASSSKLQPFLETVFQILANSHCIVVTENRPVAEFLLAMNQTQSEADHKVGVFCGGKLEAEAISESIALAENTFVTADGTTYLLDQFLCEHMYAAENGRILCVDTTSCSVTGEPLYRKLEQDGEPCGTLLPEAFHAQNLLGTLASVQHKLTTAQQVQLALGLLDWEGHEYLDPDRVLLFHGTGTPEVTFAAAKGDTAISSDFIIPWAAFTGTSLDHVQDPVETIADDAGKVPSSLLEDAAIVYHSVLYPNTSTGLEHVDSAMLTRRTLERLACIYPCV